MNEFLEFTISLNSGKIVFEREGQIIFEGLFKRKYFLFGRIELRNHAKTVVAWFEHDYTLSKSIFARDVQVKIRNQSSDLVTANYFWQQPHAIADSNGSEFLVIFHKAFRASFFERGVQIASLKIPNVEMLSRKSYKLTIRKEAGIERLFWFMLSVIYKLELVDDSDGADLQWNIVSIGPFQRELRPYDPYWQEK
jgi:hypothetical protein